MSTIADWIAQHARMQPGATALVDDFGALTYGELDSRIAAAANCLHREHKIARGEVIAWLGHNLSEQIIVTFAAARIGAMIVPLNWRLAAPELAYIVQDAGVKVLAYQAAYSETVPVLMNAANACRAVAAPDLPLHGGGDAGGGQMDDPLLLVYTSGTTGRPKGAVLSQHAVEVNALNAIDMHDMTAADHVLTVLPMFHVGGLNIQTLPALRCGARVRLHERFDPGRVLAAIADDRPTLTCLVPATIQALHAHPGWEDTDVTSLRAVATGSTDVPLECIAAFQDRGVPVIQVYGSTETGPVCMYQRPDEAFASTGSIGRCGAHSDIRIVGPDGDDLPDGEPGEILVRGGNVASGYWHDDAETASAFRDGWFHSGDVGWRDAHGQYWFKDRLKHVIISGGENIYPAELERVLRSLPGVREASVVGQADARWGQVPVAVVAVDDGGPDADGIVAGFRGRLARYKHPRSVVFTDALPRNAMGKVVIEAVQALAARALGDG